MATRLRRKLGYEDYARIPADGKRHEVLDGELYVTPAPTPQHQRLSKRLQRRLEDHFETRGLGEVFNAPIDMILGEHDIAQPDLLVVADPAQVSGRGIERAPLLVVEVLSPSTRAQDRGIKLRRYAALGVAHYWILDPDAETLECLRLEGGDYRVVADAQAPATLAPPTGPRSSSISAHCGPDGRAPGASMPERGILYNPDAARRAWTATRNFFEEVLGP